MVVIHGGSWQARYSKIVMRGLVADLVRRGWAVWNIEYRRVGAGGGWPATFADVAAAIDHLAGLDDPRLDLARVSILGHSAGGHLALWAASRAQLPPARRVRSIRRALLTRQATSGTSGALDHPPRIRPRRVIAQAGVCDLTGARRPGGPERALMGGSPEEVPERYALGDPLCHVPLELPVLLVHGVLDETVSVELSRNYADAARAAGGEVELVEIEGEAGSHRAHIDPRGEAWGAVVQRLEEPYTP